MKDFFIFFSGFIGGITTLAVIIIIVDTRVWVRDLNSKHHIGGYQPKEDVKTPPPGHDS